MVENLDIERVNFLIVGGNSHMRSIIRTILRALGGRNVCEAENGAKAIDMMHTFSADIVICEREMQPLDGLEFVRTLRTSSDSPNQMVPIIMLTGYAEKHDISEARDAGINEFLGTPVSATDLYRRIVSVILHPRQFIRTETYFGPDRHRHSDGGYEGADKRKQLGGKKR